MTSAIYRVFREAILRRQQVAFVYRGRDRKVCPHILGHTEGKEKVLAFQFGGESTSRPIGKGEWRCFFLAEVHNARRYDGPWHTGGSHKARQSCVEEVDIDVNR
ncbi:hypothetical protein NYR54_13375 [Chelativorans sp. SCAU2101]|jgi:hypothetical protein|uniref:WYL domain-containing protein n=1 Tax=Chelativorans petroleitrophicus TaxID=2975484 RepID=A0A9X2XAW4_9HYPH|nr:hypothetical protein [Chelativorans petroleitrophicus]MCT8991271.1 hypothetical protein [Chelativorans petroleitrophicus]